jgi:thiamine biosynthesis lipoprotein
VLAGLAGTVAWPALAASAESLGHVRRALFGSPVDLVVSAADPHRREAMLARTLAGLQRINDRWNAWKPGELTRLNAAIAAGRPCEVSPSLAATLRGALALERASFGCFNAGIGGLVSAWGFHADILRDGPQPNAGVLRQWQRVLPSLAHLRWHGTLIESLNPSLRVDLGGYAKGVAIDAALDDLQHAGGEGALVNLGGNLGTFGTAGVRPWRVGVRDPFDADGLLVTLDTRGREAVVTSGSYERQRLADGERVSHILDPATGRPAPSIVSATVVHPSAAVADAGATALLVAGPTRWRNVAASMRLAQVLVTERDGRCMATPALAARLCFDARLGRADLHVI